MLSDPRHKRHGHLFDGRFRAKLVDGDNYLLALSRYMHLNPVKVAGVKSKTTEEGVGYLRKYRWSGYPGYINLKSAWSLLSIRRFPL